MMNLADVVTLTPPLPHGEAVPAHLQTLAELKTIEPKIKLVSDEWDAWRKIIDRLDATASEGIVQKIAQGSPIPQWDGMDQSTTGLIAASPIVAMPVVRDIADRLGFVVVPFEYLHSDAYDRESYGMRAAIEAFPLRLDPLMDAYVLTPPIYYDVHSHVHSETDKQVYSGPLTSQAFLALSMSIPVFRSLAHSISAIDHKTRDLQNQMTRVNQEIQGIKVRLEALEAYVEQEIARKVEAERQTQVKAERQAPQARWMAQEPMLLGLPKGQTCMSMGNAIVGPCWGPDFADIVMTAVGLKKVEGQRKLIADRALGWETRSHSRRY